MGPLREAIHNHHRVLQDALRGQVNALVTRRADASGLIAFLKGELLPHAHSEEHQLYGVLDALIREHGRPTATMAVDHEFIRDYAERIARLHDGMMLTNEEGQAARESLLRQLAVELEAIVQLHLAKEEKVFLPLFERHMAESEQQALLSKVHATYQEEAKMASENILDVRETSPRERHPLIFGSFEKLNPGDSFV
ncbi:MAG: hemerythrin domain-containing protein, partial [Candidatus Binataceae bacterium]